MSYSWNNFQREFMTYFTDFALREAKKNGRRNFNLDKYCITGTKILHSNQFQNDAGVKCSGILRHISPPVRSLLFLPPILFSDNFSLHFGISGRRRTITRAKWKISWGKGTAVYFVDLKPLLSKCEHSFHWEND